MSDNEPIAWAVLLQGGDRIYDAYAIEEEAKAIDEAVTGNHGVVALYRSPTLTDEEAISGAGKSTEKANTPPTLTDEERERVSVVADWASEHLGQDDPGVVALRALMERLK